MRARSCPAPCARAALTGSCALESALERTAARSGWRRRTGSRSRWLVWKSAELFEERNGGRAHRARSLLGKPTGKAKQKARPTRGSAPGRRQAGRGRPTQPKLPGHPRSSRAWAESCVQHPHPRWIPSTPAPGLCPPPQGMVPLQGAFVSLNPHKKNDESELLTRAQKGLELGRGHRRNIHGGIL